jgi:acyl-CoA synthetase (NDP forming)
MIRNPIDAHILFIKLPALGKTLELLSDGYIDMFVISLHIEWLYNFDNGAQIKNIATYIAQSARKHTRGKPLVVVWRQYNPNPKYKKKRIMLEQTLLKAGIPVYDGLPRAVFALSKLAEYLEFKRKNNT